MTAAPEGGASRTSDTVRYDREQTSVPSACPMEPSRSCSCHATCIAPPPGRAVRQAPPVPRPLPPPPAPARAGTPLAPVSRRMTHDVLVRFRKLATVVFATPITPALGISILPSTVPSRLKNPDSRGHRKPSTAIHMKVHKLAPYWTLGNS